MDLITTAEASKLIHRSKANTSTILKQHRLRPYIRRKASYWRREDVEELVASKPELQRPYRAGPGITVNLGAKVNKPKKKPEWAVVVYTAWLRMQAGIRVGERERYGEIPRVRVEDVPAWVFDELGKKKGGDVLAD